MLQWSGKFIALSVTIEWEIYSPYIRKQKMYWINNLRSHLKKQEKQEQNKPKASKIEIIKMQKLTKSIKQKVGSLKRLIKLKSLLQD